MAYIETKYFAETDPDMGRLITAELIIATAAAVYAVDDPSKITKGLISFADTALLRESSVSDLLVEAHLFVEEDELGKSADLQERICKIQTEIEERVTSSRIGELIMQNPENSELGWLAVWGRTVKHSAWGRVDSERASLEFSEASGFWLPIPDSRKIELPQELHHVRQESA